MTAQSIRFPYVKERAHNATLWLLHQHGGMINKLKLVKLVFFADLEHLLCHGRPIVGGSYVAMQHGPVSSELLYDINNINNSGDDIPFRLQPAYNVKALAPVNEDYLSESDIKVLRGINNQHGDSDRFALRDLTHEFKLWEKNYPNDQSSHPIPYDDFFMELPPKYKPAMNIPDVGGREDMLEIIKDRQEAWAMLS